MKTNGWLCTELPNLRMGRAPALASGLNFDIPQPTKSEYGVAEPRQLRMLRTRGMQQNQPPLLAIVFALSRYLLNVR